MSTVDTRTQTRRYSRQAHFLALVSVGVGIAYLGFMILCGADILASLIGRVTASRTLTVALFAAVFSLGYTIMVLPVRFWRGFLLERRFGLSQQSPATWTLDELKGVTLSTAIFVVLAWVVYALLAVSPETWWIWAGAVWFLFTVVVSRLAPALLFPIFYKQVPIQDRELAARVEELCRAWGFPVKGVYVFNLSRNSRKATAFLFGLGGSRRVLLADTLTGHMSHDEIVAVVAHELAHHAQGHIGKLLLWTGCASMTGFYAAHRVLGEAITWEGYGSVSDVRTLPLLVTVFIGVMLVVQPLQAWFSRRLESKADLHAGRRTGHPEHLASALEKLAELNLIERRPSRLLYYLGHYHPSMERRLSSLGRLERELTENREGGQA